MEVGKTFTIRVGNREIVCVNPGVRWILETQKRCRDEFGQLDPVKYVEAILRECVVSPKGMTLDDFKHEDEVVEFLRGFRDGRNPMRPTSDAPGASE